MASPSLSLPRASPMQEEEEAKAGCESNYSFYFY
jgi:hypothetical protein